MQRIRRTVFFITAAMLLFSALAGCTGGAPGREAEKELPKPEVTGGARGELGIDRNVNEATIDGYLGRTDAVYRDMRMLEDPAAYENIGGDRYLSGYVDGFEVVPLPYIIPVNNLPGAVGDTYAGETLFSGSIGWIFTPNYEESQTILEELFPKDKTIFLMCGGGGYAGMMKTFLVSMGWDPDRIYNVGGYWFYNGENRVEVKKEENGRVAYDFESVPYHGVDFGRLTPLEESGGGEEDVRVTGVWLSAERIGLEEDMSFQLSTVVLPNEAPDKAVEWTSSDPSIAYIDASGLVRGASPGTARITVKTNDGGFTAECEVTVAAREAGERIAMDDVAEEAEAFRASDPNAIMHEMEWMDSDLERAAREGYYEFDGEGYAVTDLWRETYDRNIERAEKAMAERTEILNRLVEEKKSFVLLIYTKDCEGREYRATEGAIRILEESGIPYFYTNDMVSEYDMSLYKSKIDYTKAVSSSVVILKDGEFFAALNPDVYAMKDDRELKSWLEKYIDLKD